MMDNKRILLLIALVIVVGAGVYAALSREPSQGAQADTASSETVAPYVLVNPTGLPALDDPNPMGEIRIGAPDAPVTIVEYASLTCPHGGAFHNETLPKLTEAYVDKGLVQIWFRPFPFDGLATAGAMLAHCVAPQQRYGFLSLMFARQSNWLRSSNPLEDLQGLARQAGLSEADVLVCLKDESILGGIRDMQKAAHEQLDVRSTPTFFINGQRLEGNQPVEAFAAVIDPLLPVAEE